MYNAYLAVAASVCLIVALIEAWLMVAVLSGEDGPMNRLIPGGKELLRSHIDYLMMAQFLFVFYGLFRVLQIAPPFWLVGCLCVGSFFNPFGFLVRAVKPSYLKNPPTAFTAMMITSCIATTIGYGATAYLIASAALSSPTPGL
jgi:hypothetical protein